MTSEPEIKQQVREFYDRVGWQSAADGVYQNARYEDLRPVSAEYIHKCHLRVARHLKPSGRFLLDAGSGPVQYPEYLEYSRGYKRRVCADISITALKEARRRIGEHGLFVVADVARLPFGSGAFDGVVSLHTIHHLPQEEHVLAYREMHRVLAAGSSAALVNGWDMPPLGHILEAPIRLRKFIRRARRAHRQDVEEMDVPKGTFVRKYNARWLKRELEKFMRVEFFVWRSVSVMALRLYVQPALGGRHVLRGLYWLEERFPHFFGVYGQYPMIVIRKE